MEGNLLETNDNEDEKESKEQSNIIPDQIASLGAATVVENVEKAPTNVGSNTESPMDTSGHVQVNFHVLLNPNNFGKALRGIQSYRVVIVFENPFKHLKVELNVCQKSRHKLSQGTLYMKGTSYLPTDYTGLNIPYKYALHDSKREKILAFESLHSSSFPGGPNKQQDLNRCLHVPKDVGQQPFNQYDNEIYGEKRRTNGERKREILLTMFGSVSIDDIDKDVKGSVNEMRRIYGAYSVQGSKLLLTDRTTCEINRVLDPRIHEDPQLLIRVVRDAFQNFAELLYDSAIGEKAKFRLTVFLIMLTQREEFASKLKDIPGTLEQMMLSVRDLTTALCSNSSIVNGINTNLTEVIIKSIRSYLDSAGKMKECENAACWLYTLPLLTILKADSSTESQLPRLEWLRIEAKSSKHVSSFIKVADEISQYFDKLPGLSAAVLNLMGTNTFEILLKNVSLMGNFDCMDVFVKTLKQFGPKPFPKNVEEALFNLADSQLKYDQEKSTKFANWLLRKLDQDQEKLRNKMMLLFKITSTFHCGDAKFQDDVFNDIFVKLFLPKYGDSLSKESVFEWNLVVRMAGTHANAEVVQEKFSTMLENQEAIKRLEILVHYDSDLDERLMTPFLVRIGESLETIEKHYGLAWLYEKAIGESL